MSIGAPGPVRTAGPADTTVTRRPAAVLWDMDGTLIDTEPYWIRAEKELVARYGGVWTDEMALACVGNPLLASAEVIIANSAVPMTAPEVVDHLIAEVLAAMRAHVPWRPGARALLDEAVAAGVPCALVTMSYTELADELIGTLPPETFAAVVTGDTVTHGKPHPEPYLKAARLLGVDPKDAVAVEDSATGVRSAVAAGVPTVAVPHVVQVPATAGAVQIDSLEGLTLGDLTGLFG